MSKILLVENKPLNKKFVTEILESNGYGVIQAVDIESSYDIAKMESPDLIILDLQVENLETLDAYKREKIAPIICLSSPFIKDRFEIGKSLGCVGHISKPINPEDFIRTVAKTIALGMKECNSMFEINEDVILIVDDTEHNLKLLESLLFPFGYKTIKARSGQEAIDMTLKFKPDLLLLDIMMPGMDGFEVCKKLKSIKETADIPIIFVSALDSVQDKIKGFEHGAHDYITKPYYHNEIRVRVSSALKLKNLQDELRVKNSLLKRENLKLERNEQIVLSLVKVMEAKGPYLQGHAQRVTDLAADIGNVLKLPHEDIHILKQGAMLHDVGKIGIADYILNKNGKLNAEDYEEIKKHPVIGENILQPLNRLDKVRQIVRNHHEKLDGSGYPDGLKGDQICVLNRIVSVVDVFDALSSDRPYRKRLSVNSAIDLLLLEAQKGWWDNEIVKALIEVISAKT